MIECRLRINLAFNSVQTRKTNCQTPTSTHPRSPHQRLGVCASVRLRRHLTLTAARHVFADARRQRFGVGVVTEDTR